MSAITFDPTYEFDAPRFYDFTQPDSIDNCDSFFDGRTEPLAPSPPKRNALKRRTITLASHPAPVTYSVTKNFAPASALRPKSSTNRSEETKSAAVAVSLTKKPPVPSQSRSTRFVAPSPTVGVKKCKPRSPTTAKSFDFKTDQRCNGSRGREPNKRLDGRSIGTGTMSANNENKPGSNERIGKVNASSIVSKPPYVGGTVKTATLANHEKTVRSMAMYRRSVSADNAVHRRSASADKASQLQKSKYATNSAFKPPVKHVQSKSASQESVKSVPGPNGIIRRSTMYRRSASAGQIQGNLGGRTGPKTPGCLPPKPPQHQIQMKPFNLMTDKIDMKYKEKLRQKLAREEEERRKQMAFHAQPMPDFSRPLYCPRTGGKHITEPHAFMLHTERRAEKRKIFDAALRQREEEVQKERGRKEEERRVREEEDIRQMRKLLVHHAEPLRLKKPFEVKRGLFPRTAAETPNFQTEQRMKERNTRLKKNDLASKL